MRRRDVILAGGATAAWLARPAFAQQGALPVVGFLNGGFPDTYAALAAAFVKGLAEAGYVEGRNVAIEYRWAEGRNDRLPALAADLVQRQVAVIAATSTPAALAAKAATASIPIVFAGGSDPVVLGLVSSLNRPGGNVTGVTQLSAETVSKRIELLHELFPGAHAVALLVNPTNPTIAEAAASETTAAARSFGLELLVLKAGTDDELESTFAKVGELKASGLAISGGDPFFVSRNHKLAALAARYSVAAIGAGRAFAIAGGMMSYGGDITDAYRLSGNYIGRVLRGEKPADLPVQQATRIELSVNLKAAKALGVTVPLTLLGRADLVIE